MEYSQGVLEEIRAAAVDGLCRFPRGGVEIGGILLGSFRSGAVEVTAAQPVDCSYANGPSYMLEAANEAAFRAALASVVEGVTVVGWYHSRTRSSLGFSAEDDAAHRRLFPDPRQIALVIRPESFGTAEAAFFLPAEQGVQEHAAASAVFAVRPAASSPRDGASRRSLRPRHSEPPAGVPPEAPSPQPPPVEASAHRLTAPGRLSRRRAELLAELGNGWDAEAARDAAPQPPQEMPVHGLVAEQGPPSAAGTEQPVLTGFEAVLQPARVPLETPAVFVPAFFEHPPEAQPALSEPALEFEPEHASAPAETAEQPLLASAEPPEEPPRMPEIETPASLEAAPVHAEQPPAPRPALPEPQPRVAHRPLPQPAPGPEWISEFPPVIPAFESPVPALAFSIGEAPLAHIAPTLVGMRAPARAEPLPPPDLQASPAIPVLRASAPGPVFPAARAHAVNVSARRLRPVPLPWAARAAAVAATVVLCIAALWYGLRPVHTVSNAPHLHLRVSESGGQLHITWDRNAIPLQTARNGTVTIRDGSRSVTVPFAPEKLRAGGLTYARTSEEVEVRLRVDGPVPAEESIRLFGPPVNAPPAAPARTGTPPPEPAPVRPAVPAEDRLKLAAATPPAAVPAEPRPRTDEPQQAAPTVREAVPTRPFRPAAMPADARSPAALPQPPNVQAAPQLASSGASAAVPSVAPPQPPRESPRPEPAYSGPIAGRLIWVGRLARGAALSIEGRRASMGIVTGELPGVPVRISAYPARLGNGELRVYASSPTVRGVREAAGPQNGWNPTVYSWDARRSSDVLVTEAPSPQNGWKGMSVRGNGGPVSVIVVDWRVAQP